MGHRAWWRGALSEVAFSASFILLLKMSRSSSISEKPAGGALRLEECRIAGMLDFIPVVVGGSLEITAMNVSCSVGALWRSAW